MDITAFNDKYFPRVNLSDKTRYQYYKYGKREFAYDKKDALVISIFQDPEEIEVLGKKDTPYREMDAVGLSRENWRNKEVRDEYLSEYCMDMDENTDYMVQDFIKNELPLYQSKSESYPSSYRRADEISDIGKKCIVRGLNPEYYDGKSQTTGVITGYDVGHGWFTVDLGKYGIEDNINWDKVFVKREDSALNEDRNHGYNHIGKRCTVTGLDPDVYGTDTNTGVITGYDARQDYYSVKFDDDTENEFIGSYQISIDSGRSNPSYIDDRYNNIGKRCRVTGGDSDLYGKVTGYNKGDDTYTVIYDDGTEDEYVGSYQIRIDEDTTSAIPSDIGNNVNVDDSTEETDEELIPSVDSDEEDLEVLTEEGEELEVAVESKPVYDYDETDIVICNDYRCDHESVVYVATDDREAVEYLRSNGVDDLYVALPEGGDILTAYDYLHDTELELQESYNINFNSVDDTDDYTTMINSYIQKISKRERSKGAGLLWRMFKQKMYEPNHFMFKVIDLSERACNILMKELPKMPLLKSKNAEITMKPYDNEWTINIRWKEEQPTYTDDDYDAWQMGKRSFRNPGDTELPDKLPFESKSRSKAVTENKTYEYKGYTINLYNGTSVWKDGKKVADNFSTERDAEEYIDELDNAKEEKTMVQLEGYKGLNIAPFRQFKKEDYYSYGGATKIGNDEPLIYSNDNFDIIICGDEDNTTMCDIQVFLGEEGDIVYGSNVRGKTPMSFPKALKLAKELATADMGYEDAIYWCDEHLEEF